MSVLGLFLVFSHLTLFVIYCCFGKCCWCWFLIPLAGMVEWQEWQDCRIAEWSNGKELLEWRECLPTYYFMVHADDDTDDDDNDNDT